MKVRKKAKIRKQYNQVPHLAQDTIWESDKNSILQIFVKLYLKSVCEVLLQICVKSYLDLCEVIIVILQICVKLYFKSVCEVILQICVSCTSNMCDVILRSVKSHTSTHMCHHPVGLDAQLVLYLHLLHTLCM